MLVQVKKWGNSASVRIPAAIMSASALHLDQLVDMREEGGRIVIEPVVPLQYDLDSMMAEMTSETFHDDEGFGAPVGDELW